MKNDVFKINNNILNIGNPKNYSLNELIKIFKNLTNKKKVLINFQGKLSQDPELTKANLNKSKFFIKKDNFINLKSGIKKFYDWYIN
jgi:nucleoside-diphosphate-sugar epimerase